MARLPRSLKKRLELAGVPTPLEQAAVPKEWLVPEDIALRRDRLCWRSSKPWPEFPGFKYAYAKRTPGPGLLEQFVALSDASDEDILRYARHWGVLVICHHGLPASHSEDCKPLTLPGRGRYVFWEPVENWRFFARHAKRVLEMAAATYNGQIIESAIVEKLFQVPPSVKGSGAAPPSVQRRRDKGVRPDRPLYLLHERKNIFEHWVGHILEAGSGDMVGRPPGKAETMTRQRAFVSYAVNCWLDWGRARPQIDWEGPTPTIELTTGGIWPMYADRLAGALALQLAFAVASSEGVATCFACGRFYTPVRRPAAGRRSFCQACGVRAAWRTSKRVTRGRFRQKQAVPSDQGEQTRNQGEQTSKRTRGPAEGRTK
jgi:hypothetical protein